MNRDGYAASLVPPPAGNTRAVKHGVYSARLQAGRANEIAEELMAAPWAADADAMAAAEAGCLLALIERIDHALSDGRVEDSRGSRGL